MIIPILIAIIVGGGLLLFIITRSGNSKSSATKKTKNRTTNKSQATIIKECTKRLTKNPRDISALTALSEIYFSAQRWEDALPLYSTLSAANNPNIDKNKVTLRYGICLLKTEKNDDALKALALAYKLAPNSYEQNFYMGMAFYKTQDFDKAISCFKRALIITPDSTEVNEPLGFSLYKSKRYKESLPFLRNVLNVQPDNKEALFSMATAMCEAGHGDKALKVFMHLRPDPTFGPQSCLEAGKMHMNQRQYDAAIQDFEIGLKIEGAPTDIRVQLRYNLATSYITNNNISKALTQLTQIQAVMPNYKDVNALVTRYSELQQNSNLQIYLMAPTSEYVALCRKVVTTYYKNAFVKIIDVTVAQEHIEISCEVETPKWQDQELFRFYRSQGAVGELYVRDFHTKLRESKCDKGFIITAGSFSAEGKKYAEGRPIDLMEKNKLVSILKKIEM